MSTARSHRSLSHEYHRQNQTHFCVGFEVVTTATMKNSLFYCITGCSSLKTNRHFGVTYRLRLQGRRIINARYKSSACYLLQAGLLFGLFLNLKIEATCSTETSVDFSGLHGVIYQRNNITFQIEQCSVSITEHGGGGEQCTQSTEAVWELIVEYYQLYITLTGWEGHLAKYKQGYKNIHCALNRQDRTRELQMIC